MGKFSGLGSIWSLIGEGVSASLLSVFVFYHYRLKRIVQFAQQSIITQHVGLFFVVLQVRLQC